MVVLLPAKANNGADTTRGQLGVLAGADDGAARFLATTISARSGGLTGALYVHAKIGIVDDAWLTVGSANLNEHSFFNDTEMNVVTCDRTVARETRLRLWVEHLERPAEEVSGELVRSSTNCGARSPASRGSPRFSALEQTIGSRSSPASRAARWDSLDPLTACLLTAER